MKKNKDVLKYLIIAIILSTAFVSCFKDKSDDPEPDVDVDAPFIIIQTPTTEPSFSTIDQQINISGYTQDNQNIQGVRWNINNGEKYSANGQSEWTAEDVPLSEGDNIFIAYAEDGSGNSSSDTLIITKNKYLVFLGTPVINPSGVFSNQAENITITVQISPNANLIANSVELIRLDENNNEAGVVCSLFDDGNLDHGDEIMGDNVFTNIHSFTLSSFENLRVKAVTNETEGEVTGYSAIFTLQVFQPFENAEVTAIQNTQDTAVNKLNEFINDYDLNTSLEKTAEWLGLQPDVQNVLLEDGNFEITYTSGLIGQIVISVIKEDGNMTQGGIVFKEEEERKNKIPLSRQTCGFNKLKSCNEELENIIIDRDVFIYEPFKTDFEPFNKGDVVKGEFNNSDIKFNVIHLKDQECTIGSLQIMTSCGFVFIDSHGINGKWFFTGQVVSENDNYKLWLKQKKLAVSKKVAYNAYLGFIPRSGHVYAVSDEFIKLLGGRFPGSIIFNSSCKSLASPDLFISFLSKGAKTYLGVDDISHGRFLKNVSVEFVHNLLTDEHTTGEAYGAVSNKLDPEGPYAFFDMVGSDKMHYSNSLINGDFEFGDLSAWTVQGDGRVITQLGYQVAPQGNYMGIVSTGLGNTTSSGQISQSFKVMEGESKIKIRWNFFSEEFLEYVGSQYQDYFIVIIQEGSVEHTEFSMNIDQFNAGYNLIKVSPGIVFDQGDVYMTGWQEMDIDITDYRGKNIILRILVGDVGDSAYDSVVLLDEIRVE